MTNNTKKLADLGIAIVRISTTTPKGSFGSYGKCALMIVDGSQGRYASQIAYRSKGVKEIVAVSEKLNWGSTPASALSTRVRSMQLQADERNAHTFRAMSHAAFVG